MEIPKNISDGLNELADGRYPEEAKNAALDVLSQVQYLASLGGIATMDDNGSITVSFEDTYPTDIGTDAGTKGIVTSPV